MARLARPCVTPIQVCDGHHYCLVGKMLRTAVSQTLNKARLVSPTVKVNNRKCIFTIRARRSALEELQLEKETDTVPEVTKITFKKPLQIAEYPDPCLRAVNARIAPAAEGVQELANEMFNIMYSDDGVGLAAPQVGVNVRMMVFNPSQEGDRSEEIVLVNPSIMKRGRKRELFEEGCLSFRDLSKERELLLGNVERPLRITVKAEDVNGNKITLDLDDLKARIFQHEYDHLQGVLFFERMKPDVMEQIKPDLIALEEKYMKENPGVEIQRI